MNKHQALMLVSIFLLGGLFIHECATSMKIEYEPIVIAEPYFVTQPRIVRKSIVTETIIPPEIIEEQLLSDEELELVCKIVYAEAGNQTELGKRLVADVIFNRVDHEEFPDSIFGVISETNQFSTYKNGKPVVSSYPEELEGIVLEEFKVRTNSEVYFFRTKRYHACGVPLFVEDDHYFNGLKE